MSRTQKRTEFVNRNQQQIYELRLEIEELQKKRETLQEEVRKLKAEAEAIQFQLDKEISINKSVLRGIEREQKNLLKMKWKNEAEEKFLESIVKESLDQDAEIEKRLVDVAAQESKVLLSKKELDKAREKLSEESVRIAAEKNNIKEQIASFEKSKADIDKTKKYLDAMKLEWVKKSASVEILISENKSLSEELKNDRAVLEKREERLAKDQENFRQASALKNRELNAREEEIKKREKKSGV